ncbi:MAG: hypothetical protein QM750_12365 [Rubrivivax sp.]
MATGGIRGARIKPNNQGAPGPIGNTTGLIVPQTAPNPHGSSAPPIKPTPKEESWWSRWGDVVHTALDVVGMIPVVGEVADGANALIYLAEGDAVNAALSAASMLPVGGQAATAAKWGKKGIDAVEAAAKAEKTGKTAAKVEKEVAGQAAKKEAKEEAAEVGGKKAGGNGGGKDKGKKKLKCGESGKYGDLKKKTGDGKFDRDHIPSKAALKARAEELLGPLGAAEKAAIDKAAAAVAIPRQAHIDVSPTYGQKLGDAAKDASNLSGSARRDVEAMLKKIDEYDEDGGCKKAYQRAAAKILRMSNKDYDDWLVKIVEGVGK